jgi:hypothetical protein
MGWRMRKGKTIGPGRWARAFASAPPSPIRDGAVTFMFAHDGIEALQSLAAVLFHYNVVTSTGKSHLAIAIARSCIRDGARGRFHNVVDLVNRLETETRNGRQGWLAEHLTRMDFIVLDELGYLPFAQSGGQLLFHLVSRLYGSFASLARLSNIAARFLRAE